MYDRFRETPEREYIEIDIDYCYDNHGYEEEEPEPQVICPECEDIHFVSEWKDAVFHDNTKQLEFLRKCYAGCDSCDTIINILTEKRK